MLTLEGTFLRTRVARRIFLFFVLAAFVPFALLASLSVEWVKSYIASQSRETLAEHGKVYGGAIYERLVLANGALAQSSAARAHRSDVPGQGDPLATPHVSAGEAEWLRWTRRLPLAADPAAARRQLMAQFKLDDEGVAFLESGRPVLALIRADDDAHLVLLRRANSGSPGLAVVVGEIVPERLWGSPDDLPYAVSMCVLAPGGKPLHCSDAKFRSHVQALAERSNNGQIAGQFQAGTGDKAERYFYSTWPVFLKPLYHLNQLLIVAIRPESSTLLGFERFAYYLFGSILLALLVVVLLSVTQIRRTIGPVDELIRATRRVATEDFGQSVAITSQDEFGELGRAFNDMTRRLGHQLDSLKLLSMIDRVLLFSRDIEPVFAMVLDHLMIDLSLDCAGIVVCDPDVEHMAVLHVRGGDGVDMPATHGVSRYRIRLDKSLAAALAGANGAFDFAEAPWTPAEKGISLPVGIAPPVHCIPIVAKGHPGGFLCLAQAQCPGIGREARATLRDLADRLGVALSAMARDMELMHQARHDDLTGLPNRLYFRERLSKELTRLNAVMRSDAAPAGDAAPPMVALLFLDLDEFKRVNDTRGHGTGDEVLRQAAGRIRGCLDETAILARLGGDEFAIVLPRVAVSETVGTLAAEILKALAVPFVVANEEHYLGASLGIAMAPTNAHEAEELLRKADTAMYQAKAHGRSRYVFFEDRMNVEALERSEIERDLRLALSQAELVLHYQPQIDLATGALAGVEALIRWQHPQRGLLGPGAFIPVAEESGLIDEIGVWVLREACRQHREWRDADVIVPRIAVNVSARQFGPGHFSEMVSGILADFDMDPAALELEVTESVFVGNMYEATDALERLRHRGVSIAIDDFGTGYSSMSYLRSLPVDVLKIDKSFVDDICAGTDAAAIARAIVSLAHTLGKTVVAEGVETDAQLNALRDWHCDVVQGYHFARPLAADLVADFVRAPASEPDNLPS